jgi:hypothetical protein
METRILHSWLPQQILASIIRSDASGKVIARLHSQQIAHQPEPRRRRRPRTRAECPTGFPQLSDTLRYVVFTTALICRNALQINLLRVAH